MTWPSRWTPGIMPIQLFRLGNFYIIGVPGEFTTMSGRRLRVRASFVIISFFGPNDSRV
jgi:neutral ceramidase